MKITPSFLIVAGGLAAAVNALHGADESALLQRGDYLVNNVGMCADCHSPRNQRGEFMREHWLQGAALAFAPTVPMPAWGGVAPAIAGLPTMTPEQAEKFFTTGVKPDGTRTRPPMPEFRFNAEDARAITAYLRSLAKTPAPLPAPAPQPNAASAKKS